jgi:TolC family type I secretion outer membrane protein
MFNKKIRRLRGVCTLLVVSALSSPGFAQYGQVRPDDMFVVHELQGRSPVTGNCPVPGDAEPLSLSGVVDRVLCANPKSSVAWAQVRQQAASLGQSLSAYLPTISLGYQAEKLRSTSAGFFPTATTDSQYNTTATVNWLLYDFGQREANHQLAKQQLFAANASQDTTIQQLFLEAAQDFYQVLAARDTVAADDASVALAKVIFDAANARYVNGVGSPGDRLQAETSLRQAELTRQRDTGTLRNAEGTLAVLMALDPNTDLSLSTAIQEPSGLEIKGVRYLIDDALARRPDLAAADAEIRAAEANVRAVRAAGRPSISLGVNLDHQRTPATGGLTNNNTIGISVTIPIFTGFKTTYQVKQAEAQLDEKIANRDQTRLDVRLSVWQAYQQLQTSTAQFETSSALSVAAQSSEKVALGRYKAGVGFILDLVNAQQSLAAAEQQKIAARYGVATSKFQLAQSIGVLNLGATLK